MCPARTSLPVKPLGLPHHFTALMHRVIFSPTTSLAVISINCSRALSISTSTVVSWNLCYCSPIFYISSPKYTAPYPTQFFQLTSPGFLSILGNDLEVPRALHERVLTFPYFFHTPPLRWSRRKRSLSSLHFVVNVNFASRSRAQFQETPLFLSHSCVLSPCAQLHHLDDLLISPDVDLPQTLILLTSYSSVHLRSLRTSTVYRLSYSFSLGAYRCFLQRSPSFSAFVLPFPTYSRRMLRLQPLP